jgi:hypothetical protein
MKDTYTRDRLLNFGLLLVLAVLIHAVYTFHVRPVAAGWQARQQASQAANAAYKPQRSVWVILKDPSGSGDHPGPLGLGGAEGGRRAAPAPARRRSAKGAPAIASCPDVASTAPARRAGGEDAT